jgi:vitamin B12 transporter
MEPIFTLLAMFAAEPADRAILVTAAREPEQRADAPASATVLTQEDIERLGMPLTADLLRLVPGVAVAVTGPPGTQTQLRIRGAEANHSLLFVDGIRFNDPAAGNEPRFELLTSDALSRIEVVRGPQSALWGSEAVGGVVALETANPLRDEGADAVAEYGSLDSARVSGSLALRHGAFGLAGSAGLLRSDGIDSFGAGGDREGFTNEAASLKTVFAPEPTSRVGIVGHWIEADNEYDGLDPVSFRRADTLDATRNRLWAIRGWGRTSWGAADGWTLSADASLIDSRNRNELDGAWLNSSFGRRTTFGAQLAKSLSLAGSSHRIIAALDHQRERFRTEDQQFGGATDQRRSRSLTALVAEWRTDWTDWLASDVAVRSDRFSAFRNATTLRAGLIVQAGGGWRANLAYGEGIAQPTFYDLFGFFPGSFVGNPQLGPERSESWEAGVRWADRNASVAFAAFSSRLEDEIVEIFDPETFLSSTANADGTSRRRGIELEGGIEVSMMRLTLAYLYLDADEQRFAGGLKAREVRRPKHSGAATLAFDLGRLAGDASLAYVGTRDDTDFDAFPALPVRLEDYWLASIQLAWRFSRGVEAFARVENGFDADYQDVVGYNTPGRRVYAGIRLRTGD